MNPLLTPLPSSLSAGITGATPEAASDMAAQQAEQMTAIKVLPPLNPPTLPEVVLCDHRQTLTLFAHFFKAAAAAEAASSVGMQQPQQQPNGGGTAASTAASGVPGAESLMLKVSAGAVALDLHLHAKAEEEVLYNAVAELGGADGGLLAQHARREHSEMGAEVDAVLLSLLGEASWHGGAQQQEGELRGAQDRQAELVQRMKRLEQAFIAHQVEEETSILPRLATHMSVARQRELAAAFIEHKRGLKLLLPGAQSPHPATPET